MDEARILILGANGQLGIALREQYMEAKTADIAELDITNQDSVNNYPWDTVDIVINAAAYTNVDGAETPEGEIICKKVNSDAVGYLSKMATKYGLTLVHISTDYVFDGIHNSHTEDEPFSPPNTYGKYKAEGDEQASKTDKHYILRTSWVIGEGKNFVRTMLSLAEKNISPTVVADQYGRLTFTSELVRAIDHLLKTNVPYGTYNVSNDGPVVSWAEITRQIFHELGRDDLVVTDITTDKYYIDKPEAAKRPLHSTLDLTKIHDTGFASRGWQEDLIKYVQKEITR